MNVINAILDEQRKKDQESKQELKPSLDKKINMEDSKAREERAIAEATASADATFSPSPSSMSSNSASALMGQIDGPSLLDYAITPSIYTARSVPVVLRGTLEIPIIVSTGGSVVEYTVECENYDVGFSIKAEREEGVTIVTDNTRIESEKESLTGKFLVGGVPCVLKFRFDNEYSWFTEKRITYKITVTPPNVKNIVAGRRRRAKISLRAVKDDLEAAEDRMKKAMESKSTLTKEIALMEKELKERKNSLKVVEKEEHVLVDRIKIRKDQQSLIEGRLENGWDDEKQLNSQMDAEISVESSPKEEEEKAALPTEPEQVNDSEKSEETPDTTETVINEKKESIPEPVVETDAELEVEPTTESVDETTTESGDKKQRETPQDAPAENGSNNADDNRAEV